MSKNFISGVEVKRGVDVEGRKKKQNEGQKGRNIIMEERKSVGKERTQDNIIMRKKKADRGEKRERRDVLF